MQSQASGDVVLFHEVQHLPRALLYLVLGVAAGPMWYLVVEQVLLGHPVGSKPAPDGVLLLLWLLVGVTLPLMMATARLETEVRSDGIRLRYPPFLRTPRHVHPLSIARCEARTYHPIREYGGWGIRWWFGRMAYNVRGNRGVELELMDGRMLMIGSQRADELAGAVRASMR
jgi:hypothetical protein